MTTEAREALAAALPDDLAYWEDRIFHSPDDKFAFAADLLAALDGWTLVPTSTVAALKAWAKAYGDRWAGGDPRIEADATLDLYAAATGQPRR